MPEFEVVWNGARDGKGGEFLNPDLRALAALRKDEPVRTFTRPVTYRELIAQTLSELRGHHQDYVTARQLSESCCITREAVIGALRPLLHHGLIERSAEPLVDQRGETPVRWRRTEYGYRWKA